jgi:serine/threonine kinase 32
LENKEIEPIFKPSSEKTNFDATYDLEELLLEEAPLEARARRQKPREQLKDDATTAEIRAEELHKMIEKLFEPFDYTLAPFDKLTSSDTGDEALVPPGTAISPLEYPKKKRKPTPIPSASSPRTPGPEDGSQAIPNQSRASTGSPNGSPPLRIMDYPPQFGDAPRSVPKNYFSDTYPRADQTTAGAEGSRSTSKSRHGISRSRRPNATTTATSDSTFDPLGSSNTTAGAVSGDGQERKPSGILGFMSRKRGRDRSPKARERGVLGKDGARVIVHS